MTWWEWVVGVGAGLLSGCGIGGGTLLLLYLTAVAGVAPHTAATINLLYFLCCSPPALIGHVRHHLVDTRAFLLTIAAGVPAALLAAYTVQWLPTDWLRRGFGVLLLYVGVKSLLDKS